MVGGVCRLFGMSGGREPVRATFWLLEAPDSLAQQSRREPDGTGLGIFDPGGRPVVSKQPIAAYEDQQFAQEAKEVSSRTFLAHVRYASTGAVSPQNTHPFEQRDRLFAHNGVIGEPERIEPELGDTASLVQGETDSERYFALITREIERDGDVGAAIARAAGWIAENLPVFALNLVLITDSELWALRYPDVHELYVLERSAGGPTGARHLEHASARGSVRVRAGDLATRPAVVVASERMDEDPGWRLLESGELVHVGPDLGITTTRVLDRPPAHQLTLAELGGKAAASQAPGAGAGAGAPEHHA
jgi:predicted glutamine amidotransferase